jgi:flagellar hook-associated protein FlgK
MPFFSIGVSALQAGQRGLEVTGQNIANANTPGYHRQVVQLASAAPLKLGKLSLGRGVDVAGIRRIVNDNIETSQIRQAAATGASESQLTFATQLESRWSNEKASPGARLESLFNQLEQLSSQLNSSAQRKLVVASADRMAREFNSLANDLLRLRDDVEQSIGTVVAEINPLTQQIARLNAEIAQQTALGISPNDLLDQRTQAIQELSRRIDVEPQFGNQGQVTLLTGGIPLVVSGRALVLEAFRDGNDRVGVRPQGTDTELTIRGGQLGGFLATRDELLPKYQTKLDELARAVARAFNAVQTTGVGVAGAFTNLTSQQPVNDVTRLLNSVGLPSPPRPGSLTIAVTDIATGQRTLTTISVDPAQQSLNDVATTIGTIAHLQAFVNAQQGTLSVMSEPGFTFDFRGDGQNEADSSGLLSALGLNSFFIGGSAATLKVSSDLLANADRLATSRSGQPGDSTNLQRLVGLRDAPLMPNQTTLSGDFLQTVADIGADVQGLTEARDTNQLLSDRLEEQRQSLSGVDPNEELVNLLKFQRMFQIASKYINVLNDAYEELLAIR